MPRFYLLIKTSFLRKHQLVSSFKGNIAVNYVLCYRIRAFDKLNQLCLEQDD